MMLDKPINESVAKKLAQLQASYIQALPNELSILEDVASTLQADALDTASINSLHQRLHKITGSAGTFGLPHISKLSRAIEQRLKNWQEQKTLSISPVQLQVLWEDIDELKQSLNQTQALANTYLPSKRQRASSEQTQQIWLVEDDPFLGQELTEQITSFGYKVRLFGSLRDVELAIKQSLPDLMLVDVLFAAENKNSTDVLRLMPEFNSSHCPVIFMSALDDFKSRIQATQLGAEGFCLKPLDVPRLMSKIVDIFAKRSAPAPRVLIVDDDRHLANHYRLTLLAAGMKAELLENPKDILQVVMSFRPELVLMDLYMPEFTGPELAGVLRQHETWDSLPIVFLSSETDLDKQISAMEYGADDFLTKPISDNQLISAVTVRIVRSRQLSALISRDSLTGLLKHSAIKEAVDVEWSRSQRDQSQLVVAMLDIDHFKTVNDSHGHAVGDLVISSVAAILRQRLRQYDIIGRYGGEEFVVVLPGCELESAHTIIDEIRTHFAQVKFRHEDSTFTCTLSAGLASTATLQGYNSAELLVAADKAMYQAKKTGRNRVVIAQAEL